MDNMPKTSPVDDDPPPPKPIPPYDPTDRVGDPRDFAFSAKVAPEGPYASAEQNEIWKKGYEAGYSAARADASAT